MTLPEQQFFALLRAGLWSESLDISLFSGKTNWNRLLRLGEKQTVLGVLGDGIGQLPLELRPNREQLRWLQSRLLQTRQHHLLLNHTLEEVNGRLRVAGVHPILLKGQGVARYYRYPEQRECGDIDLYVKPEAYATVCEALREYGQQTGEEHETLLHYHFNRNGVTIELHRKASYVPDPFIDKRLQTILNTYLCGQDQDFEKSPTGVLLPPANFDAFFLFHHFIRHFVQEGVGLRQICDWMLCLHVHKEKIDRERLLTEIRQTGMTHCWEIFGLIAVNYLGLPKEEFPGFSSKQKNEAKRVVDIILDAGNFGHYVKVNTPRPKEYYKGKCHAFKKWIRWRLKVLFIDPWLLIRWNFFSFLYSMKVALLHR